MKIWARMAADLPPTLQRLIARSQRILLPRSCPAPEGLRRLRAALCRRRTVRVTYCVLPLDVHAAIQEVRMTRLRQAMSRCAVVQSTVTPQPAWAADKY